MDGIVFSKLNEIVKNPEVISEEKQAENVWGIMPYETAEVQGNALVAPEESFPADVVLDPKLSGWHRIYVASLDLGHGIALQMKLDNEPHFSMLSAPVQVSYDVRKGGGNSQRKHRRPEHRSESPASRSWRGSG